MDFERELAELLHAVTPEPPEHLTPLRMATLPDARPPGEDAAVIELTTARADAHPPSGRHRWPAIAAAAALAAVIAGVVALVQTGYFRDSRTPQPGATGNIRPTTSAAPTVPNCRNAQLVITQGSVGLVAHGRTGSAEMIYRNKWRGPCALALPAAAIGAESTGGTAFPQLAETVRLPGHGQLVLTAHVRVTGRCQRVDHGLRINLNEGGWTYSSELGVSGCTVTPLRLSHRVVR
jgi:hypothetical protein